MYPLLLRYDKKSRPELVQHAIMRKSHKGGSPLSQSTAGWKEAPPTDSTMKLQRTSVGGPVDRWSAVLIPGVALLNRPEHGFLEFFESHVVGISDGLEFLIKVIERLNRTLVRYFAK